MKGALAQLECELWNILELPENGDGKQNHWVMGLVVGIHIDDCFIVNSKLDVTLYQPVSRLGYKGYAVIKEMIQIERPSV